MSDLHDIRTVSAADVSQRRFHDRVVIVTGAGGGISAAISARFADEGADVIVCDANDTAAVSVGGNLTSRGLRAQARVFDVLANNAGLNRRGDLLSLSDDDWSITFAVNVDAMFHLCRAVLPHMIGAGRGAIVNTASQWGLHPAPGHIAYNVSKAAVVSFTQKLARDYTPYNVRVNAVCARARFTRPCSNSVSPAKD